MWCKAEFSASLLQSSVSHDPSEIILICWFGAWETFIIINVENSCATEHICVNHAIFVVITVQQMIFAEIMESHQSTSLFSRVSLCWMVLRMGSIRGVDWEGCGGKAGPWYRAAGGDGSPLSSIGESGSPPCVSWIQHSIEGNGVLWYILQQMAFWETYWQSVTAKISLTAYWIRHWIFKANDSK